MKGMTLAVALLLMASPPVAQLEASGKAASEGCKLVAELSVEAVKAGALAACMKNPHPVVCSVAAAGQDAATSGLAKEGVAAGCTWTVKKAGPKIRLTIESAKKSADEMERVYRALNTVEGIRWLQKVLQ